MIITGGGRKNNTLFSVIENKIEYKLFTAENIDWADDRLDETTDIAKPPTRFEEMGGTEENEDE